MLEVGTEERHRDLGGRGCLEEKDPFSRSDSVPRCWSGLRGAPEESVSRRDFNQKKRDLRGWDRGGFRTRLLGSGIRAGA